MSRGYQARRKIHVIRVVFLDQVLYARTSLRGAKTCKIGKKRCVFGHIDKFWKERDRQIRRNASCKGFFFSNLKNTWLGCLLWVHGRAWHPVLPFEWPPGKKVGLWSDGGAWKGGSSSPTYEGGLKFLLLFLNGIFFVWAPKNRGHSVCNFKPEFEKF